MRWIGLLPLLFATTAFADDIAKKEAAQRYVVSAEKLKAEGKLAEACQQYEASFSTVADGGTLAALAGCYRALVSQLAARKEPTKHLCDRIDSDAKVTPSKELKTALSACHWARSEILLDAKQFEEACQASEAAADAVRTPANVVFTAGCYRDWKKLGRAWKRLLDTKQMLATQPDGDVDRLLSEMVPTIRAGRVIVVVPTAVASVLIDNEEVPKQGISVAGAEPVKDPLDKIGFALDAGTHKLRVMVAGYSAFERQIEIVDDKLERVTVDWPTEKKVEPPPPTTATPVAKSSRKKIGWITIGASAAVGAVGLGFGYDALSKQRDADKKCPAPHTNCEQPAIDLNKKADRSANVSNVLVGIGLAGAAVGTFLVLTAPRAEKTRVVPTAGPNGVGVVLTRGF